MSHNGESSASKISSGALYPPVSPTIPPASGPLLRDPILYPNPNPHSSSEEPLFRDGDTHRVVDNHMAARESRGLRRISPPRQSQYELALEFKSQFGNPSGTKRRLSESDIHQVERGSNISFVIEPLQANAHRQISKPELVPETSSQRFAGAQPQTRLLQYADHSTVKKMKEDPVDEEDDEVDDQGDMTIADEVPIVPNYEGFKAHIRRLNPGMDSQYNWLVSRIAHQQEIRFKNLLEMRVKHSQAIGRRECAAGPLCLALGGSTTLLDMNGRQLVDKSKAGGQGSSRAVSDFSNDDTNPREGALTDETFPRGVPMPPTRNFPAEFECQLCFKAKKFQKPTDWTKHVHEDVAPFTCTYENCKEPKSFKRKADWVRHENERHRHLEWWICQIEDCRHPCYRKDNFLQHIVREHKLPEPKQKTKAANKDARLTEPAWIMLEKCHHETLNRPEDEPCKFCGKSFPTWKRLTVHLAKHMERISLPIIGLVEATIVDARTITNPVEQKPSPVTPIANMEGSKLSNPSSMNSISPHLPMAYSQQQHYFNSELNSYNLGPTSYPTHNSMDSNMSGMQQPLFRFPDLAGPGMQPRFDAFSQPPMLQNFNSVPSAYQNSSGYSVPQNFGSALALPPHKSFDQSFENLAIGTISGTNYQREPPLFCWWKCCTQHCGRKVIAEFICPDCRHPKCGSCEDNMPSMPEFRGVAHQQASHEWDVQSLASVNTFCDSALGSSLPSNISGSITQGLPKTAQDEIVLILFSDQKFRSLLESAASMISKSRFTRNIRRLLLPFQRELQNAASDYREKDATRIIEKHSQWLASRLFDMSDPENKSNTCNLATHLNQRIDKLPMLERYLDSTAPSTVPSTMPGLNNAKAPKTPQPSRASVNHRTGDEVENNRSPSLPPGSSDESESGESETDMENYIDYSNFPNLEHIKNFIIGGTAFENLKQNTFQFLNPQKSPIPSPKISPDIPSEESFQGSGSTETTEVTIPDIELEEDSDDMASVASDDPALTAASDDRILYPREYFDKLEVLEKEVFDDSSFLFPEIASAAGSTQEKDHLLSSYFSFHFQTRIENNEVVRVIKTSKSARLLRLLECYNIIGRTGRSLARLRTAGYLFETLTFLVMERYTFRRRIAKTVKIPVRQVLNLGLTFELTLKGVLSELSTLQFGQDNKDIVDSIVEKQDGSHCLTAQCGEMLSSIDLSPHPSVHVGSLIVWDCAVQSLQLGVLSYAGAHLQRFDLQLIGSEIPSFQLPINIVYEDSTLREISSRPDCTVITLQRRQFQCLDKLLRSCRPWVFHQSAFRDDNEPLHLSTSIESLTDLWGPSWKIMGEHGSIQQYDIGNGSIVPWSENAEHHSIYSATNLSEVYCHWISSKDWNEQLVEANQSGLSRKYFLESDTLLIGANTEFGLNINQDCSSSPERLSRMKTQLFDQGALRIPRTFRDKRYIDSHAVQVSGTALGIISGSGIVTYKRRVGHTMKDALVERWRHNLRSPLDLEAFSGVEVSFCTRNARRRRLMHLLGSDTMRNYLNTISFNWASEDCEHAYFKALRCPKLFRKFWKDHKDWQENVGNAVSICLDALEETGIDDDSGELGALWVESFGGQGDSDGESDGEDHQEGEVESPPGALVSQTPTVAKETDPSFCEEHIVTLFRSEHTWTGFLQDSEESLTMAIVGMTCLDFLHEKGYGRRCPGQRALANDTSKSKGFPVLQTSLNLNESMLKDEKLKKEQVESGRKAIWDAKDLKRGTSFSLGSHGTLKVLTASTRTCPVIAEWSAVKSEIMKEVKNVAINEKMLGRPAERHHCEYIRGSWEAKPLPVLVMSKSAKVIFSNG